jgi:hypothetical protein
VCVCVYTHTHTHTHTYIYTYLRYTMGRLPKGSLPMIVLGPHPILREHLYGSMLISFVSSIEKHRGLVSSIGKHRGLVSSIDSASTFAGACCSKSSEESSRNPSLSKLPHSPRSCFESGRVSVLPMLSIRQHTSAYVSMRPRSCFESPMLSIRPHTSAYVSMRPHASAHVSIG